MDKWETSQVKNALDDTIKKVVFGIYNNYYNTTTIIKIIIFDIIPKIPIRPI